MAKAWWALTGTLLGFGIAGLATIGVFLIPIAIALALIGIVRYRDGSAIALVGSLGAAPLYIAWLNREGPGTVCRTVDDLTECADQWSPWPFFVVGLTLLVIPLVVSAKHPAPGSAE